MVTSMQPHDSGDLVKTVLQQPEAGRSAALRAGMPPLTRSASDGPFCVKVCREGEPSEETFYDSGTGAATHLGRVRVDEPGIHASLWRKDEDRWQQVVI